MPIYEYECAKCGVTFEMMQAVSAKPLKTCLGAGCNGEDNGKVRRIVSRSGFILKGTGWYASDYPSEDRKKGWNEESKQGKPEVESPAPTAGKKEGESPQAQTQQPAKPVEHKPKEKNPYSGGKTTKIKGKSKSSQ